MKIDWNKVEEGYSLMQTLEKENKQLKEQLQQKENIIKEAKELLSKYNDNESNYYVPVDIVLDILDKGE